MEQTDFIDDKDSTDCEWEMEESDAAVTSSDSDDTWVPATRERKPRNVKTSNKPSYQDNEELESESEHPERQSSDDNWEPEKQVKVTHENSLLVTDEIDDQRAEVGVQSYKTKMSETPVDTIKEPELGAALDMPPKKKKVWPKKYNKGPFICAYCEKYFRGLLDLTRHERTHTNDKPLVCEECGRGFSSETSLTVHRRVHTSERPFPCPKCDMRFAHKSYLKAHIAKHSDERPFVCKFCGFRVKYATSLRNHLKTHRTEKNFACEVCGKKFMTHVLCRVHQQRHADPKNRVNRIPKEGSRRRRRRCSSFSRSVCEKRNAQTIPATSLAHSKTNAAVSLQTVSFNNVPLMQGSLLVPQRPLGIAAVFPTVGPVPNGLHGLPNQTPLPLRWPVHANSPMLIPPSRPVMASSLLTKFSQAVGRNHTPRTMTPLWQGMSPVNLGTRPNILQAPHTSVLPRSVQPQMRFPTSQNTPPLIRHSSSGGIYYGIPVSVLPNGNCFTQMGNPIAQITPSAVAVASNIIAVPVISNPTPIGSLSIAKPVSSSSVLPGIPQSSKAIASSGSTLQGRSLPLSICTVPETSESTPTTLLSKTVVTTSPDATRMASLMTGLHVPSSVSTVLSSATPTGQLANSLTPTSASDTTNMHLNNTHTDNAQLTSPSSSGSKLLITSTTLPSPASTNLLQVTPNSAMHTTVNPEATVSKSVPDVNIDTSTVSALNGRALVSSLELLESVCDAEESELQTDINDNRFGGDSSSVVSMSAITEGIPDSTPALLVSTTRTTPVTIQSNHCPVMSYHEKSPTLPVQSFVSDSVTPASSLTSEAISPPSPLNTSSNNSPSSLIADIVAPFVVKSRSGSRDSPHVTSPPTSPDPLRKARLALRYFLQLRASKSISTSQSAAIKYNTSLEVPHLTPANTSRDIRQLPPPSSSNITATANLPPSMVKGSSTTSSSMDTLSKVHLASKSQPFTRDISPEVLNGGPVNNNVVVLLSSGKVKPFSSFSSDISLSEPAQPAMNPVKVNSTPMASSSPRGAPSSYSSTSSALQDTDTVTAGVSSTVVTSLTPTVSTTAAFTASPTTCSTQTSRTWRDTHTVTAGVSSTVVTTVTPTVATTAAFTASPTSTQTLTTNMPATVIPTASCTFVSTAKSCVTSTNTTSVTTSSSVPAVTPTVTPTVLSTVTPPSTCSAGECTSVLETLANYEDAVYFTVSPFMVIKTPFGPRSDNVVKQTIQS